MEQGRKVSAVPASTTFNGLTINNTAGAVTLGIAATATTFTLTAGTFDASTYLLTATTPTLTAGTLRVGASTWGVNYSFIPTSAAGFTIEYYNSSPTINGGITYQNLRFSGSGTAGASAPLTIQGDLSNTGGGALNFGANNVTLSGTVGANSIAGFTTSGTISMTKSSGTATFTGSVTAGALTINGSGGTLGLGTSLSHQINGGVTVTAGTLNGGSSTLDLTGSMSVSGTWTASTGTVNYNGTGAQTVAPVTYNNLTLLGSGPFTVTGLSTVNGTCLYSSSASTTLGTALTAGALTVNNASGTLNLGSGLTHTINGAVTVTAGTLNLGGSTINGTSGTTVSGKLTGTGTVGAVVINSGGVIQPGGSPGQINSGDETWNGGSYTCEINKGAGTPGSDWSLLNITGNLTVGATVPSPFLITVNSPSPQPAGFDEYKELDLDYREGEWEYHELRSGQVHCRCQRLPRRGLGAVQRSVLEGQPVPVRAIELCAHLWRGDDNEGLGGDW